MSSHGTLESMQATLLPLAVLSTNRASLHRPTIPYRWSLATSHRQVHRMLGRGLTIHRPIPTCLPACLHALWPTGIDMHFGAWSFVNHHHPMVLTIPPCIAHLLPSFCITARSHHKAPSYLSSHGSVILVIVHRSVPAHRVDRLGPCCIPITQSSRSIILVCTEEPW